MHWKVFPHLPGANELITHTLYIKQLDWIKIFYRIFFIKDSQSSDFYYFSGPSQIGAAFRPVEYVIALWSLSLHSGQLRRREASAIVCGRYPTIDFVCDSRQLGQLQTQVWRHCVYLFWWNILLMVPRIHMDSHMSKENFCISKLELEMWYALT